ncbi:hypothetical protein GQ600_295 [Phytophthora cactorum]|nr:hypothetical protein GQ600_295 [Phytophthora cactorum]
MDIPRGHPKPRAQVRRGDAARLQAGRRLRDGDRALGRRAAVAQGNLRGRQHLRHQDGGRYEASCPDARSHVVPLRRYVQEEDARVHRAR